MECGTHQRVWLALDTIFFDGEGGRRLRDLSPTELVDFVGGVKADLDSFVELEISLNALRATDVD